MGLGFRDSGGGDLGLRDSGGGGGFSLKEAPPAGVHERGERKRRRERRERGRRG